MCSPQPLLNTRYATKDKRPIDPPPVVFCRFFEVVDRGNGAGPVEVEIDPTDAV
ncbi:hypothetical protein BN946_scf184662.g1, partial [Trametes cinnabarina]